MSARSSAYVEEVAVARDEIVAVEVESVWRMVVELVLVFVAIAIVRASVSKQPLS